MTRIRKESRQRNVARKLAVQWWNQRARYRAKHPRLSAQERAYYSNPEAYGPQSWWWLVEKYAQRC